METIVVFEAKSRLSEILAAVELSEEVHSYQTWCANCSHHSLSPRSIR